MKKKWFSIYSSCLRYSKERSCFVSYNVPEIQYMEKSSNNFKAGIEILLLILIGSTFLIYSGSENWVRVTPSSFESGPQGSFCYKNKTGRYLLSFCKNSYCLLNITVFHITTWSIQSFSLSVLNEFQEITQTFCLTSQIK